RRGVLRSNRRGHHGRGGARPSQSRAARPLAARPLPCTRSAACPYSARPDFFGGCGTRTRSPGPGRGPGPGTVASWPPPRRGGGASSILGWAWEPWSLAFLRQLRDLDPLQLAAGRVRSFIANGVEALVKGAAVGVCDRRLAAHRAVHRLDDVEQRDL